MRLIAGCGALIAGALSLVALVFTMPLLAAMRADRHERNANDGVHWYPYDDNDPGSDVDEVES